MKKQSIFRISMLIWLFLITGAYGWDAWSSGCSSCVPSNLEEDANLLRSEIENTGLETLLDQQFLGTICENNSCGELSEEQASVFLDRTIAQKSRIIAEEDRFYNRLFAALGVGAGIAAAIISGLVFWRALAVDRGLRKTNERTIKNEVRLEAIDKKIAN